MPESLFHPEVPRFNLMILDAPVHEDDARHDREDQHVGELFGEMF